MLPALALVRAALRTKSAIYRLFTVRAEPAAEHTVVGCCCLSVCLCQVYFYQTLMTPKDTGTQHEQASAHTHAQTNQMKCKQRHSIIANR